MSQYRVTMTEVCHYEAVLDTNDHPGLGLPGFDLESLVDDLTPNMTGVLDREIFLARAQEVA